MQLCELSIKQIIISGNNPRIINKKSREFLDLVESIRAIGVQVPIHVRSNGCGKSKGDIERYELLAGERRLLAAEQAGLEKIPALNHGEISDEEAFEVMFAENYAREDLTVLEQGNAIATLLEKYKGDAKAVAAKIGKGIQWVMQRRAIHENLISDWRKAIIEDPDFRDWTPAHLQLIAAMPKNIQTDLLETYYCETPTVKNLEKDISDRMMLLANAPWDKEDPKLVKGATACSKCLKRSSSQPGLFDDTTDEGKVKRNDRCLDRKCWNAKMKAFAELKAAELRTEHKGLIYAVMPDEKLDWDQKQELQRDFGGVALQWKSAKEGETGAVPALIVHGKNAGELRWVKFPKTTAGEAAKTVKEKKPTPLKERREMLEKKRWFVVIRNLGEKVESCTVDSIVNKDRIFTVMALAATFGTDTGYGGCKCDWEGFDKIKTTEAALNKLWEEVRDTLVNNLAYTGPITQTPDHKIDNAKRIAKLLGIDVKAMFKEASEKDYPEPKAWASLKEDGTPKSEKTKTKKPKKATKAKKSKSRGK